MDRFTAYLRIPSHYAAGMRRLHWSPDSDAIEYDDGSTFAFPGEIFPFLEGFASQRPLVPFAHILHLLALLREKRTPYLGRQEEVLPRAFAQAERRYRNAGVFCALLCKNIPAAPDPLEVVPFWTGSTFELEVGASEPFFTEQEGEMPPTPPVIFEARVLYALSSYSFEEILHWLRHGRGSVSREAEEIAESVLLDKPRSLHGLFADLAQRQRLSGAVPFVEQLISALTLPPRRLEQSELPLGGYSDVTSHGQVEQLLPSQLAYDDLEFIRRYAERELLFFRREDPHVHTREELVVLLDQGVRVWGAVRLVLTAALFALGRLAERRRLPFLVAATSGDGIAIDPLQVSATEVQELIESSDLSPHPGAALEHIVSEETSAARDIVLLTHPRNLSEPHTLAAMRRLPAGCRLFAVAVDEQGGVQFSAIRAGVPVALSRFHVDLERTAPPPIKTFADPLTAWQGDIEPVPFPFCFGTHADQKPIRFAFDAAGEWLLVATPGGMLHASRTDGSHSEILPRGLVSNTIVANVDEVIGVAGGFVVVSNQPQKVLALHYDFTKRNCTAHEFEKRVTERSTASPYRVMVSYLRNLHVLIVSGATLDPESTAGPEHWCLNLSTGDRTILPLVQEMLKWPRVSDFKSKSYWSSSNTYFLSGDSLPDNSEEIWPLPRMILNAESGEVQLRHVRPAWKDFIPLEDNKPVLQGCKLTYADRRGQTLAAVFTKPGESTMLRLFHGPEGTPLAAFPHKREIPSFTLASDGRLLAREIDRGQVEIRDVCGGGAPRLFRWNGRFHPHEQIQVQLGARWLLIQNPTKAHLILWSSANLVLAGAKVINGAVVFEDEINYALPKGVMAQPWRVSGFLPPDPGKRFVKAASNNLIAVVDRFGEVALFEHTGDLVCVFFTFRQQIAVWMPDGTCFGSISLLGRPPAPHALEKIGLALRAAWERGERE